MREEREREGERERESEREGWAHGWRAVPGKGGWCPPHLQVRLGAPLLVGGDGDERRGERRPWSPGAIGQMKYETSLNIICDD